MTAEPGAERELWERRAPAWERRSGELERLSRVHGAVAMDLLAVQAGERVVDVGCGTGTTAVELAHRVGVDGGVLAVDVSGAMVAAARRHAAATGVERIEFRVADAGHGRLADDLDAVYSRFGLMFFARPARAFANLADSLRAGGRLAASVWADLGDNPWLFIPTLAAADVLGAELQLPGPDDPGPCSLADPDRLRSVLQGAGFVEIRVDDVRNHHELHEASVDDEVRALLEVGPLADAFGSADERRRVAAVDAVLAALEPYRDADTWRLPATSRVVTARRPL